MVRRFRCGALNAAPAPEPSHARTLAPSHQSMRLVSALLVLVLVPLLVAAQGRRGASAVKQVAEYDGRLTFTRLYFGGAGLGGFGFGGEAWSHDYPLADQNLS